jgi:hypothetical protein
MASSPIQIGPPTRLSKGGGTVVINSSGAITLTPNSGQTITMAGKVTPSGALGTLAWDDDFGEEVGFLAPAAKGYRYNVSLGTAAAPITGISPVFRISKTEEILESALVNGSVNEQNAAIVSMVKGTANTQVQACGGVFYAETLSTQSAHNDDACAVWAMGRVAGSGTGYAIAAYFDGRRDTATGNVSAVEIRVTNETTTDGTYSTTAASDLVGLWLTSNSTGSYDAAAGIQLGALNSSQWKVGLGFTAGSIVTYGVRDDSSAVVSYCDAGSHTYGIQLIGTYSGAAIALPGGTTLAANGLLWGGDTSLWRSAANTLSTGNLTLGTATPASAARLTLKGTTSDALGWGLWTTDSGGNRIGTLNNDGRLDLIRYSETEGAIATLALYATTPAASTRCGHYAFQAKDSLLNLHTFGLVDCLVSTVTPASLDSQVRLGYMDHYNATAAPGVVGQPNKVIAFDRSGLTWDGTVYFDLPGKTLQNFKAVTLTGAASSAVLGIGGASVVTDPSDGAIQLKPQLKFGSTAQYVVSGAAILTPTAAVGSVFGMLYTPFFYDGSANSNNVTNVVLNLVRLDRIGTNYTGVVTKAVGLECGNAIGWAASGAGSITNQYGIQIDDLTAGSSSNVGIYSSMSSGTGKYFLYGSGTAASYFGGSVTLNDAADLILGTSTGTKIGLAGAKLGFFNATPVVQPTSTTDLRTALINLGLYATGGASPLNLNGGALTAGSATLAAGTTAVAPLNFTSGTNLTTPAAGAVEYNGASFYSTVDTTNGRRVSDGWNYFRLTGSGTGITTIADFFGSNSAIPLVANGVYEIEWECYFSQATAGTATWTIVTATTALANLTGEYVGSPIGGIGAVGTPQTAAINVTSSSSTAFPVTGTEATGVTHCFRIRALLTAGNGASNVRLRLTMSAGTATPLINSYYRVRRMPAGNTGTFVA